MRTDIFSANISILAFELVVRIIDQISMHVTNYFHKLSSLLIFSRHANFVGRCELLALTNLGACGLNLHILDVGIARFQEGSDVLGFGPGLAIVGGENLICARINYGFGGPLGYKVVLHHEPFPHPVVDAGGVGVACCVARGKDLKNKAIECDVRGQPIHSASRMPICCLYARAC